MMIKLQSGLPSMFVEACDKHLSWHLVTGKGSKAAIPDACVYGMRVVQRIHMGNARPMANATS